MNQVTPQGEVAEVRQVTVRFDAAMVSALPWPGTPIEEGQHFLLRLNGVPDPASVRRAAWCEVEGVGQRIPVRRLEGAERDDALRQLRWSRAAGRR